MLVTSSGNPVPNPIAVQQKFFDPIFIPNPAGMLIRTWGWYTKTGTNAFIVNDGSPRPVECIVPDGVTLEETWQYVFVTGILSSHKDAGEDIRPLVLVRRQSDIVPVP